jgi:hypothetical protein
MSEKRKTTEDHIIDQIRSTGYPLEIEVSDLMDETWLVFNNQSYFDEDENKTREIDIYAVHGSELDQIIGVMKKQKPHIFIGTGIAVECKKSTTHAWVFFSRTNVVSPVLGKDQSLDFLEAFSNRRERFLDDFDLPELHYDKFDRIAHTYTEVRLQGDSSGKKKIFESSCQLMKYASFDMQEWRERMGSISSGRKDIQFMFLAIVFDGKLYEAIIEEGKIKLEERSHVLLRSTRYSKSKAGMSYYVIDVVVKSYFSEYLKIIDSDIHTLRSFFQSNKNWLMRKANSRMRALKPIR